MPLALEEKSAPRNKTTSDTPGLKPAFFITTMQVLYVMSSYNFATSPPCHCSDGPFLSTETQRCLRQCLLLYASFSAETKACFGSIGDR